MFISSVTLNYEISRSKVKILKRVFNLYYCIYLVIIFLFFYLRGPFILFFSHPILLSYMLIIYAFFIRVVLVVMSIRWYIYILVLIFLGGVIILIIFMTTISANEKLRNNISLYIYIWGVVYFLAIVFFYGFLFSKTTFCFIENSVVFLLGLIETRSRLIYF
jgi:NADH-ubiquinone oxidoreductase chain 6